jgi:signal transduction histidine kinase
LPILEPTVEQIATDIAEQHDAVYCELVRAFAEADDLAGAMRVLADRVRRECGAAGAEWWGAGADMVPTRLVVSGFAGGERDSVSLGGAGTLVIHGAGVPARVEAALEALTPLVRRRASEERLAHAAAALARRNEALVEFAALVAHELKAPLHAALWGEEPEAAVKEAVDLVDSLLASAQAAHVGDAMTDPRACLDRAAVSLRAEVELTSDLPATVPLPVEPLTVILRNLLSNAVSAGAGAIHVTSELSHRALRLSVEDDGAGLSAIDRYASGSGLGLTLCRQIAERYGGALELTGRVPGGTCATLTFAGPPR